jgi:hypothetical protein
MRLGNGIVVEDCDANADVAYLSSLTIERRGPAGGDLLGKVPPGTGRDSRLYVLA